MLKYGKIFGKQDGRLGCIVDKCPSTPNFKTRPDDKVRFYKYPKDVAVRLKWEKILNLMEGKHKKNRGICSIHFLESDFTINATGRFELKNIAIPSVNLDLDLVGNSIAWAFIQYRNEILCVGTSKKSEYGIISETTNNKDFTPTFLSNLRKSFLLKEGYMSANVPKCLNDAILESYVVANRKSQLSAIKHFKNTHEDNQHPKQRLYIYLREDKNRTYSQIKTNSFGRCRLCLYCFEKYNLLPFSTPLASNNKVTIKDCLTSLLPSLSEDFRLYHNICYTCYDHLMITLHFFKMTFAIQGIVNYTNTSDLIFNDDGSVENKDTSPASVKVKSAKSEEKTSNSVVNDFENDSADDNFTTHFKEDPSSDGATDQRDEENKTVNSLDEQQKNVLNKFLAKLAPIKAEDWSFTSKSPGDNVESKESLSIASENESDESCDSPGPNNSNSNNVDDAERFMDMDDSNTDNKNHIVPFNVFAHFPPTNCIISLPGGSSGISLFTEDAYFADIDVINLKENGSKGRVILLGEDKEILKNAPIDEGSNKSSELGNAEHDSLEEEMPAENSQWKSKDDLSVTNIPTDEEMSSLQVNIKCEKDDAKNLLSPILAQVSDLPFNPPAETVKIGAAPDIKNETLTNIPDVKEVLICNNFNAENSQSDIDNESKSNIIKRDPYTLNEDLDSRGDRYTIRDILNSDNDSSEYENYFSDMCPPFSNEPENSISISAIGNQSVMQSTLINYVVDNENLQYFPQFVMVTPAISNSGDLKKDFKNLNVVSLDFSMAKEKRIIFLGRPYCFSCKRAKPTCNCTRLRKNAAYGKGGMCEKCGKIISSNNRLLRRHVSKCKYTTTFTCEKCNAVFPTEIQYKNHLNRIADAPVCNYFRCRLCFVKFTKTDFKQHIIEHPNFLCPKCGKSFINNSLLYSHVKSHNNENAEIKPKEVCQYCGKMFSRGKNLKYHLRRHTQERQETCEICQKSYFDKSQLRSHVKRTHGGKRFKCEICNKMFSHSSALKVHVDVVHVRKPIATCEICDMGFARRDYYKFHMTRHHNGRAAAAKLQKAKIKKSPAICTICKKVLKNRTILRIHYKNVHLPQRFKCQFCHMTFSNYSNRDRHEKLHENPYYQFSCKICFARNKSDKELQKHMKKSHSKKPKTIYQCYLCNESFGRKYLLLHHIGNKHPIHRTPDKKKTIDALMEGKKHESVGASQ